jgi:hypothetical protein
VGEGSNQIYVSPLAFKNNKIKIELLFYPEYSRAIGKNTLKWLKCKFVSKFSGSPLPRIKSWWHP